MRDGFLGTWELIPELSLYQQGPCPVWAEYEIQERDGNLHLRVAWEMEDGGRSETAFGGPPDGSLRSIEAPGVTGLRIERRDPHTLDSCAESDGEVVAWARRVASRDARLLAVVQEGRAGDGARFRNFQVYRRAESGQPTERGR